MTAPVHQRPSMTAGGIVVLVVTLAIAYMMSQLLRNSVGVIAPNLADELKLSASQIGLLSSAFFLAFAAVQLPLGILLDRYGPKACMLVCAAIIVSGTLLFAIAESPLVITMARVLMGLGTSCYLMAPLALYARIFSPDRFAYFTGWQLAIGSIGTLLATAPLAYSAATIGWRQTFMILAAAVIPVAILIMVTVRDDRTTDPARGETLREGLRGLRDALLLPSVGLLFLMNLTVYSGFVLFVGLWGGPYLTHVYGYSLTERGALLLLPAVCQIVGMVAWGSADRVFGNYKTPVLAGALATLVIYAVLAVFGRVPPAVLAGLIAWLGFVSAFTPVVIAHGKSLFPAHLVGRGLTIMNMGSMGGVFLAQIVTGAIIDLFPAEGGVYPLSAYRAVFAFEALLIAVSCLAYLRTRDPRRGV